MDVLSILNFYVWNNNYIIIRRKTILLLDFVADENRDDDGEWLAFLSGFRFARLGCYWS